ncbi:hypothetical protein C4D60_Mb03t06260 [Musa balbisiana]|uniref:RING-type E3 ubiquitin transferase n=1 Tax=Musa balbisiana TaxID=52838 RepID=A0A4S8J900_MUSBA|nr:hypothetical protein C4D60_Mb03t06260 [Musa balbisiana]
MSSVATEDAEHNNSMELGSPPHVTSPPISESKHAGNTPPSRSDFLLSLSTKVDIATELVAKCSNGAQAVPDDEVNSFIKQLEGVIRSMADDLRDIPLSMESLSGEMIHVGLQINGQCDTDQNKLENASTPRMEMREGTSSVSESQRENKSGDMPPMANYLLGMYDGTQRNDCQSSNILPQLADTLQPAYQSFFCPLTKKIMDDPVTIDSGLTYDREAIAEWFERSKDVSENIVCPVTRMDVKEAALSSNVALRNTIKEWKERNEATRIRIASSALSLATSEAMILDAIKELQFLSQSRRFNKEQMHTIGITGLLTQFLQHESMTVRCEALELLRALAEDEDGKVIIARTRALTRTVKMMSSYSSPERHAAVSFLLELSKSELFLEKIGRTPGGILILITMKYNKDADPFAAERAEEALKNLEKLPKNIKCMAENGFVEPLLDHLIDGTEEVQTEMVSYLGEIVLEHDMKTYVAERASNALIKMVNGGSAVIRKEAFRALVQISSHPPNSKMLLDAGVVPIMIEEIFARRIQNEPLESKEEAAAILANILESDLDMDKIQVNKHGHTITSHYSIYNIVHLLKYSTQQELNVNLVKILLSLTKLPKPLATVVSVIKEIEVHQGIIEFLNSPMEELATVAAKMLIVLASHMGHTIAAGLCKIQGQPEGLVKNYDTDRMTEKQAVSVNLIAKIPHQNAPLNLALLHQGTVPIILSRIQEILRGEVRATSSRYTGYYLEGLVGVLVRFTTSLFDQEILYMALSRNLTSVFTDLLVRTGGSSEVQRLAAVGLQNLSSQSARLSRPPADIKKSTKMSFFAKSVSGSQRDGRMTLLCCPTHRGVCSSSTTFCLLESRAAERLLGCLESESPEVVEAALSAIITLLDDGVDAEGSVRALSELGAVRSVLGVLKVHREEGVLQRALWLVERFLEKGGDKLSREVSHDKVLTTVLVSAFHRGDGNTKKMAENILRHLHRILNFSTNSFVM